MSSDQDSNIHALGQLRELRLSGQMGLALRTATQAMAANPGDASIMTEAVRVLILCAQTDTAVRLYTALTDNTNNINEFEPELLVRMALQMGRTELVADMPVPDGPAWLVDLLQTGTDPQAPFALQEMQLSAAEGPSVYLFTGACPYCGHLGTLQVKTSLLMHLTGLCPACFGCYAADYADIRAFIQARYPEFLELDVSDTDWDLIDHVRPRLMESDGAPEIVRKLGQEYHFLLNEILAGYLMGEPADTGEQRP